MFCADLSEGRRSMSMSHSMKAVLSIAALCAIAVAAHADVKIAGQATRNMICSAGTCSPTSKNAVLNASDLANMLASGDVSVQSGSMAMDIDIDASLSWASAHRLTLDSYRSITFNKPVVVAGSPGALTITTNDGGTGGDFYFFDNGRADFWDLASSLVINGQTYVLTNRVAGLRRLVHESSQGFYAFVRDHTEKKAFEKSPIQHFAGIFQGLGHTISNLKILDDGEGCEGLFRIPGVGEAGDMTTIRDVHLKDVDIVVNGGAERSNGAGALAGCNYARIINASSSGVVEGGGEYSTEGGLVGWNLGTIERSRSTVSVTTQGGEVGGLVGFNNGPLDQSYATGNVIGGGGGGLVGSAGNTLNKAPITNCYATGSISINDPAFEGGGLAAWTAGNFSASYSTGEVSGGGSLGGAVGYDDSEDFFEGPSDLYWDLDTSGISNPDQGAGNIPDDPGITGLTDAQLKSGLPLGFDPTIWAQSPSINNGYPYLRLNPPQ
jgi:hypothetical protein